MYDSRDKFFVEETSKKRCKKFTEWMLHQVYGHFPHVSVTHENGVLHVSGESSKIEKFYIIKKGKDVDD